ncbi:MAG: hypothetical protein ISS82_04295 [Nanoarchaeota archaeon]|nr:hypothetical protein [Nanoarchaeota archaeon]
MSKLKKKTKKLHSKKKKLSPLNITLIIGFIIFVGLFVFSWGSRGFTGYVVSGGSDRINLDNIGLIGDEQFKVIEVQKDINSMLNLEIDSEFNSNIFAEIDDCGYWKNGKDRDSTILYSINSIKDGNFNIGDPSLNTIQQIELYKSNYLCLIIINREFQLGNYGLISLKIDQLDKDKWAIV